MSAVGKYKIKSISALTGFSPALLRVWERRHGILDPQRGGGGHRLYTEDDLTVLRHVKRLTDAGRSIGEIALIGRVSLLSQGRAADEHQRARPEPPVSGLQPLREQLVRGAIEIDRDLVTSALDRAFAAVSPDVVVEQLVVPAMVEIGDLWHDGRCSVAGEHLVSQSCLHRVRALVEVSALEAEDMRKTVCACLPGEQHEMGALMLAYYLVRRGLRVIYLGAAVPLADLEQAIAQAEPSAVYLSVSRRELYDEARAELLALARRVADRTRLFIGGTGIPEADVELTAAGATLFAGHVEISQLNGQLLPPR